MKKLITLLLTLAMIVSILVLPSQAITEAEVAGLKYTLIMQNTNGYCLSGDEDLFFGKYCMRGMAVSQDGKYLFGGFLNPNGKGSIEMFDAYTGKVISGIQFIQPENTKSSYPKGLATDDRGYVYAGLAYNPNNTRADLGIYEYSTGALKLVSHTQVLATDADTKTGVNGVTVEKVNGTYYAYMVINYKVDYLIRVNVTDPANPVLDTSFGKDGMINLLDSIYGSGNKDDFDACYLDVDTDGTIYLALGDKESGSKVKKVIAISSDGSLILRTLDCGSDVAYGIAIWNEYLIVCMQNTGKLAIYEKSTFLPIASTEVGESNIVLPFDRDDQLLNAGVSSFCNVTVVNDVLFIGDQGSEAQFDQIFAVGLTADGVKTVEAYSKGIYDRLNGIFPEETDAPAVTTEAPVVTDEITDAPATTDEITDAPTDAPIVTDAPTDAPVVTDAPATEAPKEGGCGGMITGGAVLLALIATAVVLKKKD